MPLTPPSWQIRSLSINNTSPFMERQCSTQCLQKPATGESRPHIHILFNISFNIILTFTTRSSTKAFWLNLRMNYATSCTVRQTCTEVTYTPSYTASHTTLWLLPRMYTDLKLRQQYWIQHCCWHKKCYYTAHGPYFIWQPSFATSHRRSAEWATLIR
jgi:hypothetical protein